MSDGLPTKKCKKLTLPSSPKLCKIQHVITTVNVAAVEARETQPIVQVTIPKANRHRIAGNGHNTNITPKEVATALPPLKFKKMGCELNV